MSALCFTISKALILALTFCFLLAGGHFPAFFPVSINEQRNHEEDARKDHYKY
jgi:hypothetical protein